MNNNGVLEPGKASENMEIGHDQSSQDSSIVEVCIFLF